MSGYFAVATRSWIFQTTLGCPAARNSRLLFFPYASRLSVPICNASPKFRTNITEHSRVLQALLMFRCYRTKKWEEIRGKIEESVKLKKVSPINRRYRDGVCKKRKNKRLGCYIIYFALLYIIFKQIVIVSNAICHSIFGCSTRIKKLVSYEMKFNCNLLYILLI